jgi:hypothetical protein
VRTFSTHSRLATMRAIGAGRKAGVSGPLA